MNKKISTIKGIKAVILIISLLLIISIFPLRMWTSIKEETGGGEIVGYTENVDSTHDAIQDFIAQYDRLDSISVFVNELVGGRYMRVAFWDYEKWVVMYQDLIDLGEETLPGYVEIPMGIDLEVGKTYRIFITVQNASFTVGTENITENANAAIGTFYYNDSTFDGYHLAAKYNYELPISKSKSFVYMGIVAAICIVLLIAAEFIGRKKSFGDITVHSLVKYTLNPVVTAGYAVLAFMVFPMKLFDDRITDILFYEAGLLISYLILLYAINHKRRDNREEVFTSFGSVYDNIRHYGQMILIAMAIWYGCDYMNGLANIFHTISERQMAVCLLGVIILTFSAKELLNVYNAVAVVIGAIAGFIYYNGNKLPETEKEYDLHNLILTLLIVILIECLILLLNLIRLLWLRIRNKSEWKNKKLTLSWYAVIVIAFFALIIIFRFARLWGVALAAIYSGLYFRYYVSGDPKKMLKVLSGGLSFNIIYTIGYCLYCRYFYGFIMGRYSMQFHTVTVTAEYLTIMLCATGALLIGKMIKAQDEEGFFDKLSVIWKEAVLFGFVTAYMFFSASRTGFLAIIITMFVMLVIAAITQKKKILSFISFVVICILAVVITFAPAFTLQRIVPVMIGHPYFIEIEDAVPDVRGSKDWDDYSYMSIERFISVFSEKMFSTDGIDYDYSEDKMNYDENGNPLYDADGNLIVSSQQSTDDQTLETEDAEYVEAESTEADAVVEEISEAEVAASDNPEEASGIEEYSNGRFDIWKAYLSSLNMTGHETMSAVAENGENLIHAHNSYIQIAFDHGIPTGIVFFLMIVCGIILAIVRYLKSRNEILSLLPFAIISGFAIAALTEWTFQLCNPMTIALMLTLPSLMFRDKK
ncbi:O-Antigen ligase [Butyrivibrio fibrisolvens DSM 3071]|uniref:O-Antigen ligase n=1 Tax=Butyrivibrio fibrisolvens DSM 3071 TaxID=1121131 RepID=A0A1M5XV14_BUTFI|nr:O-antigen ligase family protein [Butyrivibrio fibrisolvens]SHI03675.1 O-Antigen ligase [Butyrivibrio fibrisolvens DSM 3071]